MSVINRGSCPPIDSESWSCRACRVEYIGRRPADNICPSCVVKAVTLDNSRGSCPELGVMPVPVATLSELAFLAGQFREEQARNPVSRPPDGSWALRFAELAERLVAEAAP